MVEFVLQHGASLCGSDAVIAAEVGVLTPPWQRSNIHEFLPPDSFYDLDIVPWSPVYAAVVAGELEVVE